MGSLAGEVWKTNLILRGLPGEVLMVSGGCVIYHIGRSDHGMLSLAYKYYLKELAFARWEGWKKGCYHFVFETLLAENIAMSVLLIFIAERSSQDQSRK